MYVRLTEIVVSSTEPGQEIVEARSVVSDVLLQHLDIGVVPGIRTAALHQDDLMI